MYRVRVKEESDEFQLQHLYRYPTSDLVPLNLTLPLLSHTSCFPVPLYIMQLSLLQPLQPCHQSLVQMQNVYECVSSRHYALLSTFIETDSRKTIIISLPVLIATSAILYRRSMCLATKLQES